ncbi:MAG: hypothetical protein Q7O12_14450 [Deltaproteobacteria bacterium]|nr:hypothetical protein [Deltaproteobacteria bacterium]
MFLNSLTVKKLLLTAGLLIVLGSGVCQLPELQDYLFPVNNLESISRQARRECSRIRDDLRTLNERVDYLKWFQAHNGPDQRISKDRLLAFPFSEAIRPLAPRYFWQTNIRLAHKNRLKVERKLQYLQSRLNNIDPNPPAHPPQAGPAMPAKSAAVSGSMKQIQQFQNQLIDYKSNLMELSKQLAWL